MPYIKRNKKGKIIEVNDSSDGENDQWRDAKDPEIIALLKEIKTTDLAKQALTTTDNEMVRVLEDLIDVLLEKQIFSFTELPSPVQAKLIARKQLREDMSNLKGLIKDDDAIF